MPFWTLIAMTFRELRERRLFWLNLVLSLIVVLALASISFDTQGVNFMFGRLHVDNPNFASTSPYFHGMIITIVSELLIGLYIGFVGTIIGLISTAGIFPAFIEKGAVDLVLARPMERWKIFLAKYFGGLGFMLIQSTVFILLTYIVIGVRWQIWLPRYLLGIPLLVLLFSYLYSLSVLFGLWTRSAMASLFLTLVCWFIVIIPAQKTYEIFHSTPQFKDFTRVRQFTSLANTIVPKTSYIPTLLQQAIGETEQIDLINQKLLNQNPQLSPADQQYMLDFAHQMLHRPWYGVIGSSLLFELVILLLAGWRFQRYDF
ncbi:MAG: hypothetical protein HJJLKODD_02758 [Phycisphaerae bacterium]|nr:hypothetical protein [Phycisphaerae bacterium]